MKLGYTRMCKDQAVMIITDCWTVVGLGREKNAFNWVQNCHSFLIITVFCRPRVNYDIFLLSSHVSTSEKRKIKQNLTSNCELKSGENQGSNLIIPCTHRKEMFLSEKTEKLIEIQQSLAIIFPLFHFALFFLTLLKSCCVKLSQTAAVVH